MMHEAQTIKEQVLQNIMLLSAEDLARAVGFQGATSAFRKWCHECSIRPAPGRSNHYDPKLVRRRLDELQGLREAPAQSEPLSLVEQRRLRRASA